jgi:hypothetical protein
MRERYVRARLLVRYQQRAWYLLTFWFGAVSVLHFLDLGAARVTALIGLIGVLATVGGAIVIVGELFRRARLYRFWLLTWLLIIILLSTVILKTYLGA